MSALRKFVLFYLFLSALFFIGDLVLSTEESTNEKVEGAAVLAKHLDYLMNETLGVTKMQERINNLNFTRTRYDGQALVKNLSDTISSKIILDIKALNRTRQMLEEEIKKRIHKQSSKSIWPSCCQYDTSKTVLDKGFKTKVDDSTLCEVVSSTTPREYFQLPRVVVETMKTNLAETPFMKWQYVGSSEGVFFTYPAHSRPELCSGMNYDPRYRPWYVETASPEEKHVIIILDSSNSMAQTHNSIRLIDIARDAISSVLETLTPDDKLGILAFNDTVYFPDNCFKRGLAFVDRANIRKLKEGFLPLLEPGGQSNYVAAFEGAFDLLWSNWMESKKLRKVRPKLRIPFKCVLLFISDGDASEIHRKKVNEIYKTIREKNRNLLNVATIFAYGLGRNVNLPILEKIAKQDFDAELGTDDIELVRNRTPNEITPGRAYRIEEPSQLRNEISFFYTNLIKNDTDESPDKPSFSVPYVDSGGLGLIFTAGFTVYGRNAERKYIAAVAAVDISISDLLGDVIKLKNDDRSYVFVIDGSGRVLVHPLMPLPDGASDAPAFIRIEALERDSALKPVIKSMIEGKSGQKKIFSTRVAPAGDCNKVFAVNQTYHWRAIPNTNFSLCFVEEETDYVVSLPPKQSIIGCRDANGNPTVMSKCENMTNLRFQYHRLDLTDSPDVCRHFYQMSTVKSSVVKLAPQCFVDAVAYEQISETREKVKKYEDIFNSLLSATSQEHAGRLLNQHISEQSVCEVIRDDVVSDILWTACADNIWLNKPESHVIRRYIATRTGMIRFFPGTNLSASYDPINRDWYELALAHPGKRVFSPPYQDVAGAGNVITISHTMHTAKIPASPKNQDLTEEKVIGVMGLDLSLNSFYAKLLEFYPKCRNEWHCILMDIRGYLVLHKDYTKTDAPERKHITGDEGPLAKILLETGLMFRARCLELETTKYKVSYVVQEYAFLNRMGVSDKCTRYYMEAIPNTNIFFIAREYHRTCYYLECTIKHQLCYNHHHCVIHDDWSNKTCECPCRADLVIDNCHSFVDAHVDIVACYPFRDRGQVIKNDCIPQSLEPCYDPQCAKQTERFNCSSVVGCTWCHNSPTGSTLQRPYCSDTDQCYNGYEGQRLPGFAREQKTCQVAEDLDNKVLLITCISIALFVTILVAVTCGCCFLHKEMRVRKEKLGNSTDSRLMTSGDTVATIAAAIGARDRSQNSMSDSTSSSHESDDSIADLRVGGGFAQNLRNRQGNATSPQVVLSIVDSDGAEIARSQPRPVQIVRGNKGNGATAEDAPNSAISIGHQMRSTSAASIVLGSAGETSGFSSSGTTSKPERHYRQHARPKSRTRSGNEGTTGSSEGSAEAVIRKRILSSPEAGMTRRQRMHRKHRSEDLSSRERRRAYSDNRQSSRDRSNRPMTFASTFISVLKKRSRNKPISGTGIELENDITNERTVSPPSEARLHSPISRLRDIPCGLFAEPDNQECDIPIIESDHSDLDTMDLRFHPSATSDYVSVCSESGRISACSWLTSPAPVTPFWADQGMGSNRFPVERYGASPTEGVLPTSHSLPDLSLAVSFVDYIKNGGHLSPDIFKYDDDLEGRFARKPRETKQSESIDSQENSAANSADSALPKSGEDLSEQKKPDPRKRKHKKRTRSKDPAERIKNINTDNFIVYV